MEAIFQSPDEFRNIIIELNKVMDKMNITFNINGFFIKAWHSSYNVVADIHYEKESFAKYSCDKKYSGTILLNRLNRLLNSKFDGYLSISGNNTLNIHKNKIYKCKLRKINCDIIHNHDVSTDKFQNLSISLKMLDSTYIHTRLYLLKYIEFPDDYDLVHKIKNNLLLPYQKNITKIEQSFRNIQNKFNYI